MKHPDSPADARCYTALMPPLRKSQVAAASPAAGDAGSHPAAAEGGGKWYRRLLVAALCLAFFLQGLFSSRLKSPTTDEPIHIVSGASYIATGSILANPEHPPLVKELAGLSITSAGMGLQVSEQEMENRPAGWEIYAGNLFLRTAGVDRALFWARLPLLLLSPLLGLLVYWWGRELAGTAAGLCALFLLAADPTMVGHSYLVTTDVSVATFSLLFLLALFRYLRIPGLGRLAAAGGTLGLALCAKFSGIFLIPMAAVLLVAGFLWTRQSPSGADRPASTGARIASALYAMARIYLVALVVIQILYLSPRGPLLYLHGLRMVYSHPNPRFQAFLWGHLQRRFTSYFAVAWLVKEPLATIALALGGTVLVLRNRAIPRIGKLFLFLPPAVFFLACTLWAENIGIRYLIPALPFAYLAGGIALAWLLKGRTLLRVAGIVACAWVAVAAVGIYPDHLSYFNEAACLPNRVARIGLDGGSRCGPDWLADSNVDWGQSLPQLKSWLDRHAPGQPLRLCYFGLIPPAAYGIQYQDGRRFIAPVMSPGLYAISAHFMAFYPLHPELAWLRKEPTAVVGHAYYIFEF